MNINRIKNQLYSPELPIGLFVNYICNMWIYIAYTNPDKVVYTTL